MVQLPNLIKFNLVFVFLLLGSLSLLPVLSFAQEAQIELKFVGYGKSYQEIYVSIGNTGEITVSDITIYIDGNAYETITGASSPGTVFEEVLFLEEGEHTIEARTPEDAYDSLEVTAYKEMPKTTTTTIPEIKPGIFESIKENILWIVLCIVVVVFVVILWFVRRERYIEE